MVQEFINRVVFTLKIFFKLFDTYKKWIKAWLVIFSFEKSYSKCLFSIMSHEATNSTLAKFYLLHYTKNKSSHWELLCKKIVLGCVFVWEFELFWIIQLQMRQKSCTVESRDTLAKVSVLLKICLFAWDRRCSGF